MTEGKISIHAITLLGGKNSSAVPLSYIDQYLGDPRLYDVEETAEAYVWHKKRYTPRAWLVGSALWLPPDVILEAIKTGRLPDGSEFNQWQTALIDKGQPMLFLPGGQVRGEVRFEKYSPNELRLKATCDRRCMLILSEVYFPGWKAWVNNKPTMVYQVDYVLRGVLVDAGKNEIVFRFQPKSVRYGRIISVTTLALMAIVWLVVWRRFPD